MKIKSVFEKDFKRYGQVLEGYNFKELLDTLEQISPMPNDHFVYEASVSRLESLPIASELKNRAFGGMPIQIGFCNGVNSHLNCLEYHKDSELCITANDIIILVGFRGDMVNYNFDTINLEAFIVPAGVGIELHANTLHYAPMNILNDIGYKTAIVLSSGTNGPKPNGLASFGEDSLCSGTNKWLIVHPESNEAKEGAYIGLLGENIECPNR